MTALYIIGGIILFIFLLCIMPVGLRIKYDGDFRVFLLIGLLKIRIIPVKQKKIRISYYSEKAVKRRQKKQEKKAAKKEKKEKKTTGSKKTTQKKDSALVSSLKHFDTATDMIGTLFEMLKKVADEFFKRIKITFCSLIVTVGSPEAASTAIQYGAVCSAAGCLSAWLDQFIPIKKKNKDSVCVTPDFLADKTRAYADVKITLKVGGIFIFIFKIRKIISEIFKLLQEEEDNG